MIGDRAVAGYRVVGPVAVAVIDGTTVYLARGHCFAGADNVDHLMSIGLVEEIAEPAPESEPKPKPAPRKAASA